jgi:hypothetical protein
MTSIDWDTLSATISKPAVAVQYRFAHDPVPLDTFVTHPSFLANPPLSPIQYRAVRHAERVYLPGTYEWLAENAETKETREYWDPERNPVRMVNFLTLQWGKGAGKDHICRIISLRVAHLLLCLADPHGYYEMPAQDTIHLLNVASSSKQASRAFFHPMRRAVTRPGNWFQTMGVDVIEAARGPRRRQPQTQALQDTIRFAHHIEAISGHSDAETQEGLNLMLGVADEIDAFKRRGELARSSSERESSRSAEGIIEMLRTSARTRFPAVFKNVYISWPRYKGSMIQVLTDNARADNVANGEASEEYASGPHATWEVNPRVPGKDAFAKDYRDDPVMSAAKYECRPARALNPFFANHQAIEGCLTEAERQPLELGYELHGNAWQPVYDFSPALTPVRGAAYAVHADLALTGDRAGVAMCHVQRWEEVEAMAELADGTYSAVPEMRPVVKVDFVISYEASTAAIPPREIQIRWARLLVMELRRRHFNVRRVTFDQFQSVDSMQILRDYGIESERVSTDLASPRVTGPRGALQGPELWRNLRDLFSEDRIRLARRPRLLDELMALTRLPNGKIDHPPGGGKDEADALACAAAGAIVLGGEEELDEHGQPVPAELASAGFNWSGEPAGELPLGFSFATMGYRMDTPDALQLDGLGRPVDPLRDEEEDLTGWAHTGQS